MRGQLWHQPSCPRAWLWGTWHFPWVWKQWVNARERAPAVHFLGCLWFLFSMHIWRVSIISYRVKFPFMIPLHIKHACVWTASGYSSIWSFSMERAIWPWFKNISYYCAFSPVNWSSLSYTLPGVQACLSSQKTVFLSYPFPAKRIGSNKYARRVSPSVFLSSWHRQLRV